MSIQKTKGLYIIRIIDGETGKNLTKIEVKKKEQIIKEEQKIKYVPVNNSGNKDDKIDITGNQEKTLLDNERIKYQTMIYESQNAYNKKNLK